jgi:hypothetical protein
MAIPWLAIGEFIKAAVPAIIAAIVAWVAVQNWITAKNKLALDLFDRRHAVWRQISESYTVVLKELLEDRELAPFEVSTGLGSFGKAKEQAFFLFGSDVMKPLGELEMFLFRAGKRPQWVKGEDGGDEVDAAFLRSRQTAAAWESLTTAIVPYMMVGHIAVNRPAKRPLGLRS